MTRVFEEQADPAQLFAEIQQGVTADSPTVASTADQAPQQAIPYERFQQVNQQRKEAEDKYTTLLEQLARQQAAQQGQGYAQAQQAGQQTAQAAQDLLSQDELQWFQENALISPGDAFNQVAQLIQERSVKREVSRVEQQLRQEMGQYVNQFAQQMAPMAINSYKQQHFNTPLMQQAAPEFDALLQQEIAVNPAVVNNPQALDTLRTLALGRALEKGQIQMNPQTRSIPFSEQPGSPVGSFAPQTPQADVQAINFAQRMGIDPKVTNKIHEVFERNGVYRRDY